MPIFNNISDSQEYVLVFKTNIRRKSDIQSVSSLLDAHSGILKWNIDTADCDNVLRVESLHPDSAPVIALVNNAGYSCEELID